jgi:hypothetical protein
MTAPWITLVAIAALGILYVLLPIATNAFAQYRERRAMRCPETGKVAQVQIDPAHAARTALTGPPELRVADCSLWPERAGCAQACIALQR